LCKLVSVIVPAYNSKNTISDTINSILNQTHQYFEILIIDNGSTDDLKTFIEFNYGNFKDIKYFFIENPNAAAARNFGISKAKGNYIQFLDSDDIISTNKFQTQIELLEKFNSKIVYCNTFQFYEIDSIQSGILERINDVTCNLQQIKIDDFLFKLFFENGVKMIAVHAFLMEKSLIQKVGYWNENLSLDDDGEFFFRVYLNTDIIIYDSVSKAFYRKANPNSLSNTKKQLGFKSEFISIQSKKQKLIEAKKNVDHLGPNILRNLQSIFIYKYYDFRKKDEYKTIYFDLITNNHGFNRSLWPRKSTRFISIFLGFECIMMIKSILKRFKPPI
jgi:glycosyltransferase involved in cell wall biosynthesis